VTSSRTPSPRHPAGPPARRRAGGRRAGCRIAVGVLVAAGLATGIAGPAVALNIANLTVPDGLDRGRLLVLRSDRIDVAYNGRVQRVIPFGGELDLADLPRLVGDSRYASTVGRGRIRLGAVLAERPGTTVTAAAPAVNDLVLGDAGGVPARLTGTQAVLRLNGVTVSLDKDIKRPADTADSAGLRYGHGSSVTLARAELRGLGSAVNPQVPALRFSRGLLLSVTDTTVVGGGPGLAVQAATRAVINRVSVNGTGGPGIVVTAGSEVAFGAVTASNCAGNGIALLGPIPKLRITGQLLASHNAGDGIALRDLRGATLSGARTDGNSGAGIRVRASSGVNVAAFNSRDDRTGLYATDAGGLRVNGATMAGAKMGVTVKESSDVRLTGLRLTGIGSDGIWIGARRAVITDAQVDSVQEGMVVDSGGAITLQDSTIRGTTSGLRIGETVTGVVLERNTVSASQGVAVRLSAKQVVLRRSTLRGVGGVMVRDDADRLAITDTGITAQGSALDIADTAGTVDVAGGTFSGTGTRTVLGGGTRLTMHGTTVRGALVGIDARHAFTASDIDVQAQSTGIRLSPAAIGDIRNSRIAAADVGVAAADQARATLLDTAVRASRVSDGAVDFQGTNRWSHLQLRWLGIAALLAICAAIALEVVRKLRDRYERSNGEAPVHVLNRT
jgi:hypothetical protein